MAAVRVSGFRPGRGDDLEVGRTEVAADLVCGIGRAELTADLVRALARCSRELGGRKLGDRELGDRDVSEVRGDVATVTDAAAGMGLAR